MLPANVTCKVCGNYAKFEASQYSKDLPQVKTRYYCSTVCRDYDTWGFKILTGFFLIVFGWIFLLATSGYNFEVIFAVLGGPMLFGGIGMIWWGIKNKRSWMVAIIDEAETKSSLEDIINSEETNTD